MNIGLIDIEKVSLNIETVDTGETFLNIGIVNIHKLELNIGTIDIENFP